MECPRCHFHNMPGLTTCFRCGSVLTSDQVAIDVHPPRAPASTKPFRSIQRWLRRWFYFEKLENTSSYASGAIHHTIVRSADVIARGTVSLTRALVKFVSGLVVAIVPGLQSMIDGQFRKVRWYCAAWLILMGIGAFMYGSSMGLFAIGLAVGLHGWLAMIGWKLFTIDTGIRQRLSVMFTAILSYGLVYWFIGTWIGTFFPGNYASFDLPYYKIQKGDFLLGRNVRPENNKWERGDVVLMEVYQITDYGVADQYEVIGQVVGLPGETVTVRNAQYFIGGRALDKEGYPVPVWLRSLTTQMQVKESYYFVSCEYTLAGHGANNDMIQGLIHDGCVIRSDRILSKMTMRWLPVTRRGLLKELQ